MTGLLFDWPFLQERIMADYKHGEMDITEHQKTFEGFIRFFVYLFGTSLGILIFLAIFNS
jgi:hypothetical protein